MGFDGHTPQRIQNFGGLNTLTDATNLPAWWSPNCQDVEFLPGLVKTRPGLTSVYPAVGSSLCSYSRTYINTQQAIRTLNYFIDGNQIGTLYKEDVSNTPGVQTSFATNLLGALCNSTSLFGREYMAFSDGKFGVDAPRQFDDNNFDRVSKNGPGLAPSAVEENLSATIQAPATGASQIPNATIAAGPTGAVQNGAVITFTTTALHGYLIGDTVDVTGVGVAGYNGTFTITSATSTTFQVVGTVYGLAASGGGTVKNRRTVFFLNSPLPVKVGASVTIAGVTVGGYNGTWKVRFLTSTNFTNFQADLATSGLAASGNGTATVSGSITAGVHQVTVMFVDREGYITQPAPPKSFTATGNKRVVLSNIPTGPVGTVARIVAFTPISSGSFFYLTGTNQTIAFSDMVINDNSTTTAIFDFSDALLLSGTNIDSVFDLQVLGPCAGVTAYSSRLFWWGELNQVPNFINMSFDGGWHFSSGGSPDYPLGWTQDPTFGNGGTSFGTGVAGEAYSIQPLATGTAFGRINQSAYKDGFGATILQPATSYSVRARIGSLGALTDGTVQINVISVSTGYTSTGLLVPYTSLQDILAGGAYKSFSGLLTNPLSSIPADLVLSVQVVVGINQISSVVIDEIEVYPTNQPTLATIIRASGVEDPESYNGLTGLLEPAPENGQRVTSCFVIRNLLYMAKERSLYVTQDDGVSEPSQWTIQEVSSKIGTPSIRGVGKGDEWAVIAGESGLYYFTGGLMGEQNKLSKEIQGTWNNINWQYGHLVSVAVDPERKRIYVSVPYGASTVCNRVLTLDYTEGFQELQEGVGRKWCPWSISASSVVLIERQDTTLQLFMGNSNGTGKIYQLDLTGLIYNDDSAAIDSFWQSGFFSGAARQNVGYISGNIVGSGSMLLTLYRGDMTNVTQVRGWTLNQRGYTNVERTVQKQGYRFSGKFETNAANQFFSMQGVEFWTAPAVWAPVRGINA